MYSQFILAIIAITLLLLLLEIVKVRKLLQAYNNNIKIAPLDTRSDDELYEEAKRIIIENKTASTTILQRKLRIGYAKAVSIMDRLEENGVVGPANGAEPRIIRI